MFFWPLNHTWTPKWLNFCISVDYSTRLATIIHRSFVYLNRVYGDRKSAISVSPAHLFEIWSAKNNTRTQTFDVFKRGIFQFTKENDYLLYSCFLNRNYYSFYRVMRMKHYKLYFFLLQNGIHFSELSQLNAILKCLVVNSCLSSRCFFHLSRCSFYTNIYRFACIHKRS